MFLVSFNLKHGQKLESLMLLFNHSMPQFFADACTIQEKIIVNLFQLE